MRRKQGAIIPLEMSILEAAKDLQKRGIVEYHGFMLAKEMKEKKDARLLTAYGTLYKALDRMEKAGLLASRWEDPYIAAGESRPRRRLYQITASGQKALVQAQPAGSRTRIKLEPRKALP